MKKFFLLILVVFSIVSLVSVSGCEVQLGTNSDSGENSTNNSYTTSKNDDSKRPEFSGNNSSQKQSDSIGGDSKKSETSKETSVNKSTSKSTPTSTGGGGYASVSLDPTLPTETVPTEKDGDIYLSPSGSDSNSGTKGSPLKSLQVAVDKATPGTTIFMNEGVYEISNRVNLSKSGTKDEPITIQALNWGNVELNFSKQTPGNNSTTAVGIYLTGNYWKLQGLTICYAGDNGIKVEGSNNYIGRCSTHHNLDTGIQLGFGHTMSNPDGLLCAYNLIENCDSYLNCDHDSNYGADADGFACKMYAGKGNVFIGCRSWRNADDAWDLYEMDYSVLIQDCWAWESGKEEDFINGWVEQRVTSCGMSYRGNGSFNGNGNGIKLGGNSSNGVQIVKNCVAFGCNITGSVKGFDQNHNAGGINLENCVSWNNGKNYMLDDSSKFGHSITNSLSFYSTATKVDDNKNIGELIGSGSVTNCNFTLDGGDLILNKTLPVLSANDFITIAEADAKAPRQADGSLPNNGFARLKTTSPYYSLGMGLK